MMAIGRYRENKKQNKTKNLNKLIDELCKMNQTSSTSALTWTRNLSQQNAAKQEFDFF